MSREEGIFFDGVDDDVVRKEKAKARELRKSRWWRNKLDKGRCYYCNKPTSPSELTMDHVVPIARGGVSAKNNLVACCKDCNNRKRIMLPQEWEEYLGGKLPEEND